MVSICGASAVDVRWQCVSITEEIEPHSGHVGKAYRDTLRIMRVVSLVPSATEMLAAIGGADLLVGRSHDSTWPPEVLRAPVVTTTVIDTNAAPRDIDRRVARSMETSGTLHVLDAPLLAELQPDVVLAQRTCGVCAIDPDHLEDTLRDCSISASVVETDPDTLEDVLDDIVRIGDACGRADAARGEVARLRERWWSARDLVNPYLDGPSVAVIEWVDPLYLAGHWTPTLIEEAGGRCVAVAPGQPSVQVSPDTLIAAAPSHLVIAPCGIGLDAMAMHVEALRAQHWWGELPAVRAARVALHDGMRTWSRPGPGLVPAFEWLAAWINDRPEAMPADFPGRVLHPVDPAADR